MERITAADAAFLDMEHPVVHLHVTDVLGVDVDVDLGRHRHLYRS